MTRTEARYEARCFESLSTPFDDFGVKFGALAYFSCCWNESVFSYAVQRCSQMHVVTRNREYCVSVLCAIRVIE